MSEYKKSTWETYKLARFHRKIEDPYNPGRFTDFEVFVLKPTKEHPLPCIMVSIRNGHTKLFFRVATIKDLLACFKIPPSARQRLNNALIAANVEADEIERDMKLIFARRKHPNSKLIDADTGEVVAEAERIIREKQ